MEWTVGKLAEAAGGRLLSGNPEEALASVGTDTRMLRPGDAFVALVGERFDGHDFIADALEKGVRAVVAEAGRLKAPVPPDLAVIAVEDTLFALGETARWLRNRFAIPVVGVTGSNGKTSTKEMLASVLGQDAPVLKTQGNFNNLIGVPLTLLGLQREHRAAVVEMGISTPGEMARLAEIVRPTVGVITNIHTAHLEGLNSVDQVCAEKGKLWQALGADGLAVVNMDDPRLMRLAGTIKARRLTYSLADASADVRLAGGVRREGTESLFGIALGAETVPVRLSVLGLHQVQNAVTAAAVAFGLGASPETIARGLALHRPVSQRMQVQPLKDGTILVNDVYNANPASMKAALEAVAGVRDGKPFLAVLGEMRELGEESAALHWEVGRKAGRVGVTRLITLGRLAAHIAEGAREAGLPADACYHAASHEDAAAKARGDWRPGGGWILVKGSRGMSMERVVKGIVDGEN